MRRCASFARRCVSLPGATRPTIAADVVGSAAHRSLAREVARKSIVLLRNEGNLLPLVKRQRLAVIGHLAATPNTGDGGSSNTRPAYVVTPLDGLRAALGDGAAIAYDEGSDPAAAAKSAAGADAVLSSSATPMPTRANSSRPISYRRSRRAFRRRQRKRPSSRERWLAAPVARVFRRAAIARG